MSTYEDSAEGALQLLADNMDEPFVRVINKARDKREAFLVPDPSVAGVWAIEDAAGVVRVLIRTSTGDFEDDDAWLYGRSFDTA